ncbi:MAG: NTPase [bacterium]
MVKHILLTGKPRSGKTTLLMRIVNEIKSSCGGFYTEEILKENERIGFRIKTIDGKEGILAEKGKKSKFMVGKYGVVLEELERIGVRAIEKAIKDKKIIVIDEIGKMELFSNAFRDVVLKAFSSGKRVIGTIHIQNSRFLNEIKQRNDVCLFEVNLSNHNEILDRISDIMDIYHA